MVPRFTWSISLPGVATTICTPFLNWVICNDMLCPPYTARVLIPTYLENFLISLVTCIANSLVGTNINACIGPFLLMLFKMGSENQRSSLSLYELAQLHPCPLKSAEWII